MTKALRLAVLTSILALTAAPVFADPTGTDPPPPTQKSGATTASTVVSAILTALGS